MDLVFTDPPYGIAYEAMREGVHSIANDASLNDAGEVIGAALGFVSDAEAHYVCCDWRSLAMMKSAMEGAGIAPRACIVWDKLHPRQNLDRFGKRYELILYAGPYGGQKTVASDVWQVERDYKPAHPTPKPVSLVARAIGFASEPGDLVIDPFMGAGSTLRAAKDLGRRAIGIELEERYCETAAVRLGQGAFDFGGQAA